MRSLMFLITTLLIGCQPSGPSADEMIRSAQELDKQWADAFNAGDIDRLMDLYWKSPDLLVYPSDAMVLRGWDQVRTSYHEMLIHMKGATAEIGATEYHPAGDLVISYGTWSISVPTLEGPIFTIHGRFSDVKALKQGKWVIVKEHGSVPMPPPPTREMSM